MSSITAKSQPVYPDTSCWNDYWKAGEWMLWFEELKAEYGKKQARSLWYAAWTQFPNNACFAQTRIESDDVFHEFLTREKLGEDDFTDTIEDTTANLSSFINILPWALLLLIFFVVMFIVISVAGDKEIKGAVGKAAGSWLDRSIF